MYNANKDRAERNRKSLDELRRDLNERERALSVKKPTVQSAQEHLVRIHLRLLFFIRLTSSSWQKTNKAEFRRHVELAKATLKKASAAEDRSDNTVL